MTSQRAHGSQRISLGLTDTPTNVKIPLNLAGSQYFRGSGYCLLRLTHIHWPYTSIITGILGHLVFAIDGFAPNTFMMGDRSIQYTWMCPIQIDTISGIYSYYSQTANDDVIVDYETISRVPVLNMHVFILYGEDPFNSPPLGLPVSKGHYAAVEFVIG